MENSNDFLSQSYCQSIERITRTEDHTFNFQIPEKLLKIRKKAWDDLFGKYSKEMSDDIELNIDTLEPDEEEIEKEVSEEEYSCEHLARIPMRKPASLVQYWINTGNQPYNALLDENDVSETGVSLSEKEITLSSCLSVSNIINEGNKQTHKIESSYSSVNTAAYILSNANITNKADTIAIIKSVKCGKNNNSSGNIKDVTVTYNKSQFIENTRINCITNNDNSNVNNNIPDIELCSMSKESTGSKPCDQPTANIVTSGNTIQSNMYSQSEHTDQVDVLSISQRSLDIQDRNNIVRQFDEATKEWIGDYENNDDASNQDKILEKDISYKKKIPENIAQEIIKKDTNLSAFYRKKLYTGRNSPVDLIQTERHSINRLSGTKQSLHPALDSDCTTQRKILLVHKGKSKNSSSLEKTNLNSKNTKRRKHSSIFDKNVTNTSDELSNNNSIQNNNLESSFKISSHYNNLDKQDDIPLLECNDTNISKRNKTCEQDLASFNMNPVVLLERIVPCFKRHESISTKSNHITRKCNVHNYRDLNELSNISEVEDVDLEKIESDDSTILVCQCKTYAERTFPFLKESDCSLNLKLSVEHDSSVSNTEEKDNKLSSLKNTDVSQNKESYNTLEELSPRSEINKDCTNVREIKVIVERLPSTMESQELSPRSEINKDCTNVREIKVIVERLPSTMESQVSNKNNTVQQKNVSSKSKTFPCNSYRTNELDNVRSREIKVLLERLPASVNKSFTNTIMKTEIWNKNDIHTQQKDVLKKFKTHSFNTSGINRTDNVKLREIKIPLERLPPNICFNDTNISDDKNIILENTNLHNNKRKRQIKEMSNISARENVKAPIRTVTKVDNNYSFRTHAKSKKNNDSKINDTSDVVAKHEIFDKTESELPIQYKNNSKASQGNRSKYSVLTFTSSDEDDFVRLIRPKKRSKYKRINDKLLDEANIIEKNLCDETKFVVPNKDEYHYSRHLRTVIFPSKEPETRRGTFESVKERKESREMKIKSFDNTNTFLKMCENETFLFTPNENDNDSVAKNLDKRKRRASFLNYNKNINNNNEVCSNAIMKRNEIIDYEDDTYGIFFQTKTFYSDSSNSEENNSYIAPTRKAYKNSSVHHKSHHNNANLEEFFNNAIAERHSRKSSSLLTSTFKKHDVGRKHDIKIGFVSTSKKSKISKRLDNEECNDNINSKINNTRENMLPPCFINDTSIHSHRKMVSSNSFEKNNFSSLSRNEQISNKSKKSEVIQQDDVKSAKLLVFQTKTYYDSDSNESL